MTTKTKLKVTAIQNPTPDNTVVVQRQMKESIEVGQRLRGDPGDSFVRVSELIQGGLWNLVNGVLVPGNVGTGGGGGGGGGGTVTTADSVQGNGSSGSPIILVGDSASPGNTMLYGTNGSGTKGWYAQPSGGSSSLASLSDVTLTSPSVGQFLEYNGSKWINAALPVNAVNGITGGPTLVQKTLFRWQGPSSSAGSTAVTLSNTPTVGNVLVAIGVGYDTGGSGSYLTLPTGFQRVGYFNTNGSEGVAIGVRVVQAGDGTSYTFGGGNGGNVFGLWEFSNVQNVTAVQCPSTSVSGTVLTIADVPDSANAYNIGVAQTDNVNAYSSISGATLLFDGTSSGTGTNNHPGIFFQPPATMSNVVITYTGTGLNFPIGVLVSVQGPPGLSAGTGVTLQQAILSDNPTAFYKCDDASGGFADLSGNGYNQSTVNGTVNYRFTPLVPSQPLDLFAYIPNGNNGVQITSQLGQTYPLTNWTAECVFCPSPGASGTFRLFDVRPSGSPNAVLSFDYESGAGFRIYFGSSSAITATWNFNSNAQPVHICITCSTSGGTSTLNAYANGVYIATASVGANTVTGTMISSIGYLPGSAATSPMYIGYVAFFNYAIPVSRIATHAQAAGFLGPAVPSTPGANVSPDTHPASPTAMDEEFEGTTVSAAWTQHFSSGSSATIVAGNYVFSGSPTGSVAMLQPAPSPPWEFTIKSQGMFATSGAATWAVGCYNSGNNNTAQTFVYSDGNVYIQRGSLNSSTWAYTFSTNPLSGAGGNINRVLPTYIKLAMNSAGTTLTVSVSLSGVPGTFVTLGTESVSSWLSAVTHVVLGAGLGGNGNQAIVDWFRRTA